MAGGPTTPCSPCMQGQYRDIRSRLAQRECAKLQLANFSSEAAIPSHPIPSLPVPSRPVPSRPVPCDGVRSSRVLSSPFLSRPVPSRAIACGRVASFRVLSCPVPSRPVRSRAVESRPVESFPVPSRPVPCDRVRSSRVLSSPFLSRPVPSRAIACGRVASCRVLSCPVPSRAIACGRVASCRVLSCPVPSRPVRSREVESRPVKSCAPPLLSRPVPSRPVPLCPVESLKSACHAIFKTQIRRVAPFSPTPRLPVHQLPCGHAGHLQGAAPMHRALAFCGLWDFQMGESSCGFLKGSKRAIPSTKRVQLEVDLHFEGAVLSITFRVPVVSLQTTGEKVCRFDRISVPSSQWGVFVSK